MRRHRKSDHSGCGFHWFPLRAVRYGGAPFARQRVRSPESWWMGVRRLGNLVYHPELAPTSKRAKGGGGRGIRTPGTLPGTVVFKTTAIDHSAIPPRRDSGHNSRFSRERRPHHPVSVTVTVTNGTARDDRGPARPYDSARPIEVLSEAESIRQRGNRRFSRGAPWVVPRFIEMLADEWS